MSEAEMLLEAIRNLLEEGFIEVSGYDENGEAIYKKKEVS